jgi:hypothetical protein
MANFRTGRHIARWSADRRTVDIMPDASVDAVLHSYPVTPAGCRPAAGMLLDTGWSPYPGSEWDEGPPGVWTIAVYQHQPGKESGETGDAP